MKKHDIVTILFISILTILLGPVLIFFVGVIVSLFIRGPFGQDKLYSIVPKWLLNIYQYNHEHNVGQLGKCNLKDHIGIWISLIYFVLSIVGVISSSILCAEEENYRWMKKEKESPDMIFSIPILCLAEGILYTCYFYKIWDLQPVGIFTALLRGITATLVLLALNYPLMLVPYNRNWIWVIVINLVFAVVMVYTFLFTLYPYLLVAWVGILLAYNKMNKKRDIKKY